MEILFKKGWSANEGKRKMDFQKVSMRGFDGGYVAAYDAAEGSACGKL